MEWNSKTKVIEQMDQHSRDDKGKLNTLSSNLKRPSNRKNYSETSPVKQDVKEDSNNNAIAPEQSKGHLPNMGNHPRLHKLVPKY